MFEDLRSQFDARESVEPSPEPSPELIVEVQLLWLLGCLANERGDEYEAEFYWTEMSHIDGSAYPPQFGWGGGD